WPSTVSDLNKKIYGTIEAWRNRPIEGEHPYVYLDGIVLKRSWAGEVRNVSLLVAIGVNESGYRQILGICEGFRMASVARPRQCHVELALDHGMDEFANPIAQASFDRVKPMVEKVDSRLGCRLQGLKLRGNARHGVVSSPALQRRMIRG